MRQYIDTLQDVQGNALVGASVLVQNYIGAGNASIFSDNGLTPITTSTIITGADGQFMFFAADGDYNLVMSKAGTVFKTQSPVSLFDGTPQLTYNDSGGTNAFRIANAALEKVLRPGLRASFLAFSTNTGAATFSYNGLTPGSIVVPPAGTLPIATIISGGIYQVELDASGNWQIKNGVATSVAYPRTQTEITAGVTPTNLGIDPMLLDPRRYGAVGDGNTDDTGALNNWVSVVNATTNPTSTWPNSFTFLCGPLNAITAANFTWNANSGILVRGNSWGTTAPTLSNHVTISGIGARLRALRINGNTAAFTVAPFGYLLNLTGNDVLMSDCNLTLSPSGIITFGSISQGRISNCHFDTSANSVNIVACSYLKFVNCTANLNGYPFGSTIVPGVPISSGGFGWSLRFRSHHIEFTNCEALQNCLVGFNLDQGCYAIKLVASIAWMNGDAGIALAADNTSAGTPGNSEGIYDCEFIDCESYNNWGCGLTAYAPAFNCTVDGGRYYNNHRLAGIAAEVSSGYNGIYFAGGSIGIRIRTKAYDDRQHVPITSAATGILAATGWVAGTMGNYPRVALYNASLAFQGWGTITAEAAGTVTIVTTAINGVTIASIAAGWFVSQAVQSNGVFFDNACQGTADVDGFGFMPGAAGPTLTGFKVMSGFTAGGQNVLVPNEQLDYTELLANCTFDAGTSSGTAWAYSTAGTGGAANFYTTAGPNLRSPGALQLIGGAGNNATGDASLITSGLSYVQNVFVEISFWCSAVDPGDAQLIMFFNTGGGQVFTVVNHPGGGYKQLKVGGFMPVGTTQCNPRIQAAAGKTTYWDNGSMRVRSPSTDNRDFTYPSRELAV